METHTIYRRGKRWMVWNTVERFAEGFFDSIEAAESFVRTVYGA